MVVVFTKMPGDSDIAVLRWAALRREDSGLSWINVKFLTLNLILNSLNPPKAVTELVFSLYSSVIGPVTCRVLVSGILAVDFFAIILPPSLIKITFFTVLLPSSQFFYVLRKIVSSCWQMPKHSGIPGQIISYLQKSK